MDAQGTREALMRILENHPPSVGRVLKLDPSLMRSETYLASYPELRDFLAQHDEIPQNAQFYLEGSGLARTTTTSPQPEARAAGWNPGGFAAFIAAGIICTLIWLIRTVLDQRRWSRLSKIQAEVHSKLMDRFSSNDELLTYVQTPSGRRFLESGPSLAQEAAPAMAAPVADPLVDADRRGPAGDGDGAAVPERPGVVRGAGFFYIAGCMSTASAPGSWSPRRRLRSLAPARPARPAASGPARQKSMRDLTLTEIERLRAEDADAAVPLEMDEESFRGFYDRTARTLRAYLARVTGDARSRTISCRRRITGSSAPAAAMRAKRTGATPCSGSRPT